MNECYFGGKLNRECSCKQSSKGTPYCNITIEIETQNGHTAYVDCVAFGELAETIGENYCKGDEIQLVTEAFTERKDVNGKTIYRPKFNVLEITGEVKKEVKMPETKEQFPTFNDELPFR
jgi:single-stranded DNA-binding protein